MAKIVTTSSLVIFLIVFGVLYPVFAFTLYDLSATHEYEGGLSQDILQRAGLWLTAGETRNLTEGEQEFWDFEGMSYTIRWWGPPHNYLIFYRTTWFGLVQTKLEVYSPINKIERGIEYSETEIIADWDTNWNWTRAIIGKGTASQAQVLIKPNPEYETIEESLTAGKLTILIGRGYEDMQESDVWSLAGRYVNFAGSMLFGNSDEYPVPFYLNIVNWCILAIGVATIFLYVRGI